MTTYSAPIHVMLIDDANILRALIEHYLRAQPEILLAASADTVEQARTQLNGHAPEIVVIGLRRSTRRDIAELRRALPNARLILMGMLDVNGTRSLATSIGTDGYVDKTNLMADLMPEIKRLAGRGSP